MQNNDGNTSGGPVSKCDLKRAHKARCKGCRSYTNTILSHARECAGTAYARGDHLCAGCVDAAHRVGAKGTEVVK